MPIINGNEDVVDALRALYCQVLAVPVEEVDINLSFISLGGDSFRGVVLFQKCLEKHIQVSYQAIMSRSLAENAALATEARKSLDKDANSTASLNRGKHKRFNLMPKDYDLSSIELVLRQHHGSGLECIEDIYPCSVMQENMYIGQSMGGSSMYQTTSIYTVPSSYTLDHIRDAWQQVVHRHQTLRTVYVETSDSSSGRLLDAVVLLKTASKVLAGTSEDRDKILTRSSIEPSTLGLGKYHRLTVYPDAGSEVGRRLLKVELNHITVDATSMIVLIDELGQALQGCLFLKSPPTGYGKYIEYLQLRTDEDRALDHWIDYLDAVQPCHFPALNDHRQHQAGSSELIEVPVSTSLTRLRQFCQTSRITVATALQAAWAQVLHIYTGDPDVCFGYLCSGRSLPIPGVTEIVGPMMNLMLCRIRDVGNMFLQELVDTIRDDFSDALPHQSFSLRNVQRILGNSESKLFNTVVNTFYGSSKLVGDSDQLIKLVSSHNASDLEIVVKAIYTDVDLRIRLAYSSTTLSHTMAKHVAHTFAAIVERMVTIPDSSSCRVSEVTTASPYDIQEMTQWNDRSLKDPDFRTACVHELIVMTAHKHPRLPAIHAWDGHMDYELLDKASSALAHLIAQRGFGTKKYIALCFEKSKWYSVALLGVMKSGNAFVPIDLSNPDQRRRKILNQLKTANKGEDIVICSPKLAEKCAMLAQHTIVLEQQSLDESLALGSTDNALPISKPNDPAYVIFTSGSTGEPKGVVIEHGAYSHAARTHGSNLHIDQKSRVLQFASYGFDTSMEDHLTTFVLGGCLCVPSEENRLSIPDLAAFALQSQANWAHITPSFAEMLTRREFPTLKTMVLGGEPMTFGNIREWSKTSESRLIQVYGPSECCVTSTVNADVAADSTPTDIGTALPGCATWVTRADDPQTLSAVGAVGELLIEGPILARGYINEPELTSAVFVRGLKWAPDRRMYRTGDLVKYDSKGQLRFVGRSDGQVKIHGQRIELGETERQLVLHPLIQHALTMAPKSGPCVNRLVAVVSPKSQESHTDSIAKVSAPPVHELDLVDGSWCGLISDMRNFLDERLPAYMVPEVWIVLKKIPKNSSAKLDRKRVAYYLEHLDSDDYTALVNRMEEQSLERPGSLTEIKIRDLWAEVLNIPEDEIQWTSSFFSLGGDSISAMTVASLGLRQGLSFSGADILRHRNIERLAKSLPPSPYLSPQSSCGAAIESEQPAGLDEDAFPLSPIQRLHFRVSDGQGDPFDQQTIVLKVRESVDEDVLASAFEAILGAHPMLRARFFRNEDASSLQGPWSQRIASMTEAAGGQGARLRFHSLARDDYILESIAEAKSAINIAEGPLVAADLFQGKDRMLLYMTIHHLVVDTVSWRIILQELETHLRGGTNFAPEPTSFKAWCLAQQQFASHLDSQSVIPSPFPAYDRSFWAVDQEQNTFEATENYTGKLDGRLMKKLQHLCGSMGCDLVDLLSAAITTSFSEVFGRPPSLFLEGHGRENFKPGLDASSTVGWFTTFSPAQPSPSEVEAGEFIRGLNKVRDWRKLIPLNGFSYFTSVMSNDSESDDSAALVDCLPMEVVLNHLGAFQQVEKAGSLFQRCDGDLQSTLSALRHRQRSTSRRYALISIVSIVQDDSLVLEIEWNKHMLHQEQIRSWINRLEATLDRLFDSGNSQKLDRDIRTPKIFGIDTRKAYEVIEPTCQRLGVELSDVEAVYPCSPIQDSLMLSQLRHPNGVYIQHFMFRIIPSDKKVHGLDSRRLAEAWKSVVAKHSILRTVFAQDDSGSFLQLVLRSINADVQCLPLENEETLSEVWATGSQLAGISPLNGKVLHSLKIYTTNSGSVYCMLSKNHLITDGTSSRLLVSDFIAAYEGRMETEATPYANYIDFVCRQNLVSMTQYWQNYLDAVTPCRLTYPNSSNGSEPAIQQSNFEVMEGIIPESASINLASQGMDLTSPVVFKAAWAWVLRTYLNSEDVVFGVLSSGRDIQIAGAQRIVGPMASMLPIRARIPPGCSAIELCRRIQEDDIEHMSHQAISLAKIQHAIKRGDEPLFNTILNIQKSGGVYAPRGPTSLQFKLLHACDTSEYDVALSITEANGEFKLSMEYPTWFMSQCEATNLLQVFKQAVQQMIAEPDGSINTTSIATSRDKDLIQRWNAQPWDTEDRLVHELVKETVAKQPSLPAIWSWDGKLTYSELDTESTRLAEQLRFLGCSMGSIVVLCFEKSIWAVVSMLAVAKAGAGFVHIDPNGPVERIKSIIQQTGSTLGLSSAGNAARISGLLTKTLTVDQPTMASFLSTPPHEYDLSSEADPSSVLYIIFTSGSTGRPKGVVIQHRSFCSAARHNRSWLQIEQDSRVLQFTSYCFDASLEEIFTVLIAGGCICIPSEQDRLSDIPGFVRRARVNWAAFTPSFIRTMSPSDLPSIKFITVHAEPMSGSLVKQWAGTVRMRPSYGPTECSVTSTVGAPFAPDSNAGNIGWPVGCRGWIVDPENHDVLLPVGAIGELVIDGPIVGRGYLGDPEKTAASFIAPPAWSLDTELKMSDADPHRRLYKTGDLVRYTSDGSLVILGRKDHSQVKVRGQRVEIQEIQHCLGKAPHVLHSMVIMPDSGALRGRLVAVLSLECLAAEILPAQEEGDKGRIRLVSKRLLNTKLASEVAQNLESIQGTLSRALPAYMMPEDLLVFETMPVQISHKLDRQAILNWVENVDEGTLQMAQDLQSHSGGQTACGSATEQAIREILGQVLELPISRISLHTSFFRLGGDSIYAIQVMRRCRDRGLAVTTQDVLGNPTVAQLAVIATSRQGIDFAALSSVGPAKQSSEGQYASMMDVSLLPFPRDHVQHVWPCSPFQQRIYKAFHDRPYKPYIFDTFIELTDPPNDPSRLVKTWNQVVERHDILRTAFISTPNSDRVLQVLLNENPTDAAVISVASELDALRHCERRLDTVRSSMFADSSSPLSLGVYVSPQKRTFVHLIMSHILIDHVSFAHLLSDWQCFYQGREPSPASLPSFGCYISHLSDNRNMDASNIFWTDALKGAEPCLLVPAKASKSMEKALVPWEMGSVKFTVEMTPEREAFCQDKGITLSNLLQFSWSLLLHLHTGNPDVVFGHLVSDRDVEIPNAEAVVGPMLSITMGRVQFQDSSSLLDSLRKLQEHNIRALGHKIYDMTYVEKHIGVGADGLFDTLVNIRKVKYRGGEAQDPGAFRSISKRDPHEQQVVLAFNEGQSRLDAEITFYKHVLESQKVAKMADSYCQILHGLLSGQLKTLEDVRHLGLESDGNST